MSKKIYLLFFFTTFCFAQISWESKHIFILKKDEFGTIHFHEKGKNKKTHTFIFKFRWTLFDGQKVVVLSNYRDFPRQNVLYFETKVNNFRQVLLGEMNAEKRTYLLVQMKKYNEKKGEISFMVVVKDSNRKFTIKYIDPERKS